MTILCRIMKITHLIGILLLLVAGLLARHWYFKPKFITGEKAPPFEEKLLTGADFSLESLQGSYVVLDFWGSWCGPCRKENPQWVRLYNEMKNQQFDNARSFEIVSIAIETNSEQWKRAIQKDHLVWRYHIGQFDRFRSAIAEKYGIREIPTNYFLSPKGLIIGVNLRPDEIATFLRKHTR